jgi:hypothetical protein
MMPTRTDRRIRVLTVLGVICVMLGLGILAPIIVGSASNAKAASKAAAAASRSASALVQSESISGCRSTFAAKVQDARTDLDIARALLELIQSDGLDAAVHSDRARLDSDAARAIPARDAVLDKIRTLAKVTDDYTKATELSVSDRTAFLRECSQ